jgi:hypothetical protein
MENHKGLATLALLLSFILLGLAGEASAVTVGPAKIEVKTDPGNIVEGRVYVFNEGEETATFYADFEKFVEINGQRKFLPTEEAELANWFQMERTVTLGPQQGKDIPFTASIPENAPPGGHFAVIWWGTAPPEEGQVGIVTRAGILAFFEISGEVDEKGEVSTFSLPKGGFFVFQLPEDFEVEFKNVGNTYLKPLGEIRIKNILGSEIALFSVNENKRNILPENISILDIAPQFEEKPFALGLYRAELTLRWGGEPDVFQKSFYFFVFPWKTILLGLIILLILIFLLTRGIKKYNQWVVKKYARQPQPEPSEPPRTLEFESITKKEFKKPRKLKIRKVGRKTKPYK